MNFHVGSTFQSLSSKSAENEDITNQSMYVAIEYNVLTTLTVSLCRATDERFA